LFKNHTKPHREYLSLEYKFQLSGPRLETSIEMDIFMQEHQKKKKKDLTIFLNYIFSLGFKFSEYAPSTGSARAY